MASRRRTYFSDVTIRSIHVGAVPPSPSIGQTSANNPSRTDIPAHLLLVSTPMTIGPGSDSTPAAAAVIASSGTILTASSNNRVAPTGNVTGVILQPPQVGSTSTGGSGVSDGNLIYVTNESAFTLTFATDATSNVYNGTSVQIPAKTCVAFIWDLKLNSGAGLYVVSASAISNLSGNQAISGNLVITSNSANALTAGPNGSTNPTFNVDASTSSDATGLNIKGAAAAGGLAISVISSGTNENLTIDAKGSGAVTIGSVSTGAVGVNTNLVITTASANGLAVGLNGTTNPAFLVNAATASSATGLKVTSAAVAGGLAVAVISSGTNENLTLDAKGSGTITLNGTGTGAVAVGSSITITSVSANALAVGRQGTTNPVLAVNAATSTVVTGLLITGAAAAAGLALAVTSSGTNENLTINAKGSGTITLGSVSTGAIIVDNSLTVASTSANGLAVGANGTTNPVLTVVCSTSSVATGISITGAAAAGGVAVAVTSSGTNENFTVDAKGSGTLIVGGISTGLVSLGRGSASSIIESSTLATLSAQNITPSAANLLGGYVAHVSATGAGTFTLPTGTAMSTGVPGVAVGDSFDFIMANTGNQTSTITANTGFTIVGSTVAITTGKTAWVSCRNTGSNTWVAYVVAAQ